MWSWFFLSKCLVSIVFFNFIAITFPHAFAKIRAVKQGSFNLKELMKVEVQKQPPELLHVKRCS